MKYMLLIYDCDPPGPGAPMFEEALARINAFADECRRRGALLGGDPLKGAETATTVRVRDGQTLMTDGPYAESHEQLGGYYLLDCPSLDEALELAAACPFAVWGTVEVRPLAFAPGIDNSP